MGHDDELVVMECIGWPNIGYLALLVDPQQPMASGHEGSRISGGFFSRAMILGSELSISAE